MELSFDHYPVFQANQVLTSRHLNDVFGYLDEQTRLTRANLIGIGIVCGLEIKLDSAGTTISLSKGCGVTSKGYLIVELEDVSLVAYRPYTLPDDVDYPTFKDSGTAYTMWELFEKGEPNTTPLNSPAGFLDDKAVVLFLELKNEDLRNCSPINCDDKGSEVTVTVRRLLMQIADLDKIIAAANQLGTGLTSSDLANALSAELNLPDVPVPRFDVLNSNPSSSDDVYAAFLNVFRTPKLANTTAKALSAAYAAFQPLLKASYPADPFANFSTTFGFLDSAPKSVTQVRFLQYYVDLFEDLLHAYDEFRWKGVELICACCPPDGLFPRHLMLGLLHPEKSSHPAQYRETFRPSPAIGNCAADSEALLQLFTRLVEMAARFTNAPSLPKANDQARIDPQIRITPSVLGDVLLAKKAIPYYYRQNGTPPLYQLWSREKTLRNRATQNLSYRYDEYSPAAPLFVSDPLRYDLERYNFLRIEGYLGKDYQRVLTSLLLLKAQYRLPIDIVALRTGAYDDTQPVDLSQESARFEDLETLYDALREEVLSSLAEGAMDLYDVVISDNKLQGGAPQLPLLRKYAPNYRYPAGSVGAVYEEHLARFQGFSYIDVDQTLISDPKFAQEVLKVYCQLFVSISDLPLENRPHAVALFYFSKLAEILPVSLDTLAYVDFENRYQDLLALVRYFRNDMASQVPPDLKTFVPEAELIDQFDEILFNCKLEAVKAVHDEYTRRLGELKKRQFLSSFLQQHPGIQHKAGVPMGGTFLIIYHGEPVTGLNVSDNVIVNTGAIAEAFGPKLAPNFAKAAGLVNTAAPQNTGAVDINTKMAQLSGELKNLDVNQFALSDAINRLSSNQALLQNPDIKLVLGSLTGNIPHAPKKPGQGIDDPAAEIIASAVNALDNGTVIADFFLPYKLCSDVPGIDFVLPKIPPSLSTKIGCTNSDGNASVEITVKGGVQPYDLAVDGGTYDALRSPQLLPAGTHTLKVRDAEGLESTPQTISIPATIALGTVQYTCDGGKYTAAFSITGGTPPYTVNGKAIPGNTFTTDPVDSGTAVDIEVLDNLKCSLKQSLTHDCPPPCDLPCNGIAVRRGYRFWMPAPDAQNQYKKFGVGRISFSVDADATTHVDLSAKVQPIITAKPADLNASFEKVAVSWLNAINKLIAAEPKLNGGGKANWLALSYESLGAGRLGTLWIEHFECLNFSINIDCVLGLSGGSQHMVSNYDSTGTNLQVVQTPPAAPVTIPAFDGQKSDKCNPGTPVTNLCPEAPQIGLTISKTVNGSSVTLQVTVDHDSPDLQFLWEVQDAKPAMGNGRKFTTTLTNIANKPLVSVTAFTKDGCSVSKATQIIVG